MPVATCARVSTERQERQQTIDSHVAALRACRRAPCGCRCIRRRDAVPGHLVVDEAEMVRMIYGWLTDGGTAIRQILKRLNAGSYFPRSGRHRWSPSVVHHILADPIYAGTAYANRYTLVPPKKPRRGRGPRSHEASCRRPRSGTTSRNFSPIQRGWWRSSRASPPWRMDPTASAPPINCSARGWSARAAPANACSAPTRPASSAWPRRPRQGSMRHAPAWADGSGSLPALMPAPALPRRRRGRLRRGVAAAALPLARQPR
ncbi:MAG: recombinase family protein, partial [Acetobacteraceae bacterium]|nr:recombinase family protein [Acetobacteraceae bacterium]